MKQNASISRPCRRLLTPTTSPELRNVPSNISEPMPGAETDPKLPEVIFHGLALSDGHLGYPHPHPFSPGPCMHGDFLAFEAHCCLQSLLQLVVIRLRKHVGGAISIQNFTYFPFLQLSASYLDGILTNSSFKHSIVVTLTLSVSVTTAGPQRVKGPALNEVASPPIWKCRRILDPSQ